MTPIRRQYLRIKQRYPDAIVLFRLGDFYETFDDDARLASRELDIVLTSKAMGKGLKVPLAGVPAHALESYLARLVKRGHKVAICEQLSDPSTSGGLVDRDVVRVVTPGTVLEPSLLDRKANNYLAALVVDGQKAGLAYVDITTGEFRTTQLGETELVAELGRLSPSELLAPEGQDTPAQDGRVVTTLPTSSFALEPARRALLDHFHVLTLESFGCDGLPLAVGAAGAVVEYLAQTQRNALPELRGLTTYSTSSFMVLDPQTRRNLDLFQASGWDSAGPTLYSSLDLTRTAMGGRLLRRWLGQPLLDIQMLRQRQDAVGFFHAPLARRERMLTLLSKVADLERAANRVRLGIATPRELLSLQAGLEAAEAMLPLFGEEDAEAISWLRERFQPCGDVVELIEAAIAPEPAGEPGQGSVIKEGFSTELDELKAASSNARGYVAGLERKERERSGIRNLKVGYNKVFGYFIEVSNPNLAQVPTGYVRRQTLVGGERFITPELKEYESLILNARERIEDLERDTYRRVCGQIGERAQTIGSVADGVAHLDVFAALAEAASRYGYARPHLTEGGAIRIQGGRHPVVERVMPSGTFVPNDLSMSTDDTQLIVLTGPNMAGKSTFIRQAALIVLMAQIGSFVPAESAEIGLVDRIFTRVGLQDDLATGKSTFMVEMVETASILSQATSRSLVILDEIGRGTSTYDGLSIARSVAEYIHNDPRLGCKTLFATHYHELTQLAATLPRVRNHTVAVSEEGGEVVFLHRIVPGGADKSYGIHVARLAGLPGAVINRAWEVLEGLESDGATVTRASSGRTRQNRGRAAQQGLQVPLFSETSPLAEELAGLDVSSMTPLEAINKLYELQQQGRDYLRSDPPPSTGRNTTEIPPNRRGATNRPRGG